MMRPRIPVWQRRLMRPEFNGGGPNPGPWRPGNPDAPGRGPGPRGLLETPTRGPLHARTPYDRPGDGAPQGRSQANIEKLPETQKQILGMIDLAQKQLQMEREKILNQFSQKDDNGPLGSGPGPGQREGPGLLGERPDGPVPLGRGPLGKGPVSEKPGLLGQRPDQFPGPNMEAGQGNRMNGVRPPANGPRPLMGVQVRPPSGMDNSRGPLSGPQVPGMGGSRSSMPGPRAAMSGPDDMLGSRGAASNPRQMGPMGMQNPGNAGPMQNQRQMGSMGMQNSRQVAPMDNQRQMGNMGMQNSRQAAPMQNQRQMGQGEGLSQGGPMQNVGAMGSRGSGLNGPSSGPRPLMGGLSGPLGSNMPDTRGSLLQNPGGMSQSQMPAGGLQRSGFSSQPYQGVGEMDDWRYSSSASQDMPQQRLQGGLDWQRGQTGGSDWQRGQMGASDWQRGQMGASDWQRGQMGTSDWQRGQMGTSDWQRGQMGTSDWQKGQMGTSDWQRGQMGASESDWQRGQLDRERQDYMLGSGRDVRDFSGARLNDRDYYSGYSNDRFLSERIEDRRFQPTSADSLYPSRMSSHLGGRDFF